MIVYVIEKEMFDNEEYVKETGSCGRHIGYDLKRKSMREIFASKENANEYLDKKLKEMEEQGKEVQRTDNKVKGYRKVRDYMRLTSYTIRERVVK